MMEFKHPGALFQTIVLWFVLAIPSPGQPKKDSIASDRKAGVFISADYDRCGLTYVLCDLQGDKRFQEVADRFRETVGVSDKFFDNRIRSSTFSKSQIESALKSANPMFQNTRNQMAQILKQHRTANQIMDVIFASDGKIWKLDTLLHRGKYNMTDDQVLLLKNSAKGFTSGSENAVWSEKILRKSFILTFSIRNISSYNEIYDRLDARNLETSKRSKGKIPFRPVERLYRGYRADAEVFCYKIDINDSLMNVLWSSYEFKARRDSIQYPLELVGQTSFELKSVESAQTLFPKNDAQFVSEMVSLMAGKALKAMETQISDFRVKTPLVSVRPPEAKIGMKEGLTPDQRFFVYENEIRNGKLVSIRKGVIRARAIADNRTIATGQSSQSKFYQVAGSRLAPGMLMEQKNDLGISIFAGSAIPTSENRNVFTSRISYNLSSALKTDGSGKQVPNQVRIFVDFDMYFKSGTDSLKALQRYFGSGVKNNNMQSLGFGLGGQRDYHFLRYFQFSPFASLNYNLVSYSDTTLNRLAENELGEDWGRTLSIKAGTELGINLYHNLKLVGSGFVNTFFKRPEWDLPSKGKASDAISNRIKPGLMLVVKLRYDL